MEWDFIVGRGGGAVGSHFSQSFVCPLQKHCLLSLTSSWALTFGTSPQRTWTMCLYSSQVTCPWCHLLYASFLCLSLEVLPIHPQKSPGIFAWLPTHVFWALSSLQGNKKPYSMGLQQKSLKRHILFSLLGKKSLAVKSDECCLLHTASSELQMLLPWEHPGETWCCIHMWKGCIFMSVSDRSGGQWCGKDENCCGVLHGVLKQGSLSVNLAGDNLLKQVVTDRE